jgi:hypothetical protein
MPEKFAIPAATIRDVDLNGTDVELASEILRLGALMERGNETPAQFGQLILLMHQAGHYAKAEYLLRRNIEGVADGHALYRELFGTEKPDEFAAAINGFEEQFAVRLKLVKPGVFLDAVYSTVPQKARFDVFRLLNEPCEVRIDYAKEDWVEAQVSRFESDDHLILRWVHAVWNISEPI